MRGYIFIDVSPFKKKKSLCHRWIIIVTAESGIHYLIVSLLVTLALVECALVFTMEIH